MRLPGSSLQQRELAGADHWGQVENYRSRVQRLSTFTRVYLLRYTVAVNRKEVATRWPVWALIREARHRAGLTQAQLAQRVGTSQPAIARYEKARSMPDIATLFRMVEACGLELRLQLAEPDRQRLATERAAMERSPEERLLANQAYTELASELRRG